MDRLNKALGFALALSLVAVACAAPAIPSDLDEDSSPSEAASTKKPSTAKTPPKTDNTPAPDPSNPTPADPSNPTPADPTPTPGSCGAKATFDECFQCCDAPTGGALKKADDAFGQCACGGGQCAAACGTTFCTGQQPSAACDTCLTNTCDPAASALCTTAACKVGEQCLEASACGDKP